MCSGCDVYLVLYWKQVSAAVSTTVVDEEFYKQQVKMEDYPFTFQEIPLSEFEDDPDIKVCVFIQVLQLRKTISRMFTKSLQSKEQDLNALVLIVLLLLRENRM